MNKGRKKCTLPSYEWEVNKGCRQLSATVHLSQSLEWSLDPSRAAGPYSGSVTVISKRSEEGWMINNMINTCDLIGTLLCSWILKAYRVYKWKKRNHLSSHYLFTIIMWIIYISYIYKLCLCTIHIMIEAQ